MSKNIFYYGVILKIIGFMSIFVGTFLLKDPENWVIYIGFPTMLYGDCLMRIYNKKEDD